MSDYTRQGIAGLCIAAAFAVIGVALRATDASLARDISGLLLVVSVIAAVASLIAIARGVGEKSSD